MPLPLFSCKVTGGILAGGRSRRFGSNKALFAPEGTPWIEQAAHLLRSLCSEVLVSASPVNAQDYRFLDLEIVVDEHPDSGPLGGLEAMLDRCTTSWLLVLTCDMPYVDGCSLQRMINHGCLAEALDGHCVQAVAWQRASDGSRSPFPLLIQRSVLPRLREQMSQGHYGVKAFLHKLDTYYIITESERLLSNINSESEWKALLSE